MLRRGLGFWQLTFKGQHATLKHEQGLAYVAYLLLNPPDEPIHALDLATRIAVLNGKQVGMAEIVDPKSGQKVYLENHARIQERSPALDDALEMQSVLRQQNRLEDLLEQDPVEPIKEEVERELIVLYDYETKHSGRTRDSAQKAVHAVRTAIKRFHQKLLKARDAEGLPNQVLRSFATHLNDYLLLPSAPCSATGMRIRSEFPGCFTYEPPPGVRWLA
jgi:hypothetical protein